MDDTTIKTGAADKVIRKMRERVEAGDVGAPFEPQFIDRLAELRACERGEYERILHDLKKRNIRAHDLDQAVRARGAKDGRKPSTSPNEDAAALQFVDCHGDDLRFNTTSKHWHVWDGAKWARNESKLAFAWAREIAREIGNANPAIVNITSRAAFAAAVEQFAGADQRLTVDFTHWDRDPWLLGTPDGVADLKTGEMRGPRREDFITKSTLVAPGDDTECPLWQEFLSEAFAEDQTLIDFAQRWSGYCLTGITREHALVFCYGGGGHGKTTFQKTRQRIMHDYARTAAMEMLINSKNDRHHAELAYLDGARMVTASETEDDKQWAEAKLKQLTGGDKIHARYMRRDPFEFEPKFKLDIIGNHMPTLRHVDEAIRRRLHILPFTRKPKEIDKELEEKLIAQEAPAILRWMIVGCLQWQRSGLNPPDFVRLATDDYLDEQNTMAKWMAECCIISPAANDTTTNLFASWCEYCERHREMPGSHKAFTQEMKKQFATATVHGVTVFKGIKSRTSEGRKRAIANGKKMGPRFKLTPHQQQEALRRVAAGESMVDIGRSYNVSHATISRLASRAPAPLAS
jgi:putative DNA primase/helicase